MHIAQRQRIHPPCPGHGNHAVGRAYESDELGVAVVHVAHYIVLLHGTFKNADRMSLEIIKILRDVSLLFFVACCQYNHCKKQ